MILIAGSIYNWPLEPASGVGPTLVTLAQPTVKSVCLAYEPPTNNIFLLEQTSHQPANNTLLSEQIITSNQPPAKRTE
jgi:hypothetical protein